MTLSSKVMTLSWADGDFLCPDGLVQVRFGDIFSFVGLGH
jgi:hypothetical protein